MKKITCTIIFSILLLPTFLFSQCLSGTYNLGGTSPDFTTFASVEFALENLGVCGAVTINVFPGVYNERLDLDHIPGSSATNTIEIVSTSTNVGDVKLSVPSENFGSLPNFVLRVNGADYVTFKGITIQRTGSGTQANAVIVDNQSEHIHFENNIIETRYPSNNLLDDIYTVWVTDSLNHDISFVGNTINRGYIGLWMEASATSTTNNVLIQNNVFDNSRDIHLKLSYLNNVTLDGNTFTSNNTNLTFATRLRSIQNGLTITNNKVYITDAQGIFLWNCIGTANNPISIVNNMVKTESYCLPISNSHYVDIYHNSLYSTGTSYSGTTLNIYSNSTNINVINNNITSLGYCVDLPSNVNTNYNNLYSAVNTIGRFNNTNYTTLASWQTGTSQDAQSVSLPISYVSSNDLHIDNQLNFDNLGTPIAGITTDIDGEIRDQTSPDIGADEYTYIPPNAVFNDLALVDFKDYTKSTLNYVCHSSGQPLEVIIKNTGDNNITGFLVDFKQNGVSQNLTQWTGFLAPNDEDTIIVGSLFQQLAMQLI